MSDYLDTTQVLLPEAYLVAIGRVCVQWSQLETIADLAIRKLAGFELLDTRATIITAHMSWPMKQNILYALVEQYRDRHSHLAKFDELKPIYKKAQDGRNRVVHASWSFENGKVSTLRATAREKLKSHIDPISVVDINAISDQIGFAAAQTLKAILNK